MARAGFKRWWTQRIPAALERSTYVLISAIGLTALCVAWVPVPGHVWSVPGPAAVGLDVLCAAGWILVVASTFAIDHFELAGLRQAWSAYTGRPIPPAQLRVPLLYRIVRHPMQLGFMIGMWSASTMSVSRLVLAVLMTAYILVGLYFEERDLVRHFGSDYDAYRARVPMLLPWPRPRKR
jgi:protein-S-isoprenylcysteine O-methyltransferase Ste14